MSFKLCSSTKLKEGKHLSFKASIVFPAQHVTHCGDRKQLRPNTSSHFKDVNILSEASSTGKNGEYYVFDPVEYPVNPNNKKDSWKKLRERLTEASCHYGCKFICTTTGKWGGKSVNGLHWHAMNCSHSIIHNSKKSAASKVKGKIKLANTNGTTLLNGRYEGHQNKPRASSTSKAKSADQACTCSKVNLQQ